MYHYRAKNQVEICNSYLPAERQESKTAVFTDILQPPVSRHLCQLPVKGLDPTEESSLLKFYLQMVSCIHKRIQKSFANKL